MPAERLQKILAEAGVDSRRGSERLIEAGRVTVDGVVAHLGEKGDAASQLIAVDGVPIAPPTRRRVHLAMHKPAGVTATVRDPHARRTVIDLVPAELRAQTGRLYPVGRLDLDSEGLLLLTDDGPWAERLLHPRYGVEREYAVGLEVPLDRGRAVALTAGIELEEGLGRLTSIRLATDAETRRLVALLAPGAGSPASASRRGPSLVWYRAVLAQGWHRQLRRMFGAVEAPIARLVRVRLGTLRLDLPSGACRALTAQEVRQLRGSGRREIAPGGFPAEPDDGDHEVAQRQPTMTRPSPRRRRGTGSKRQPPAC